MGMEVMLVGPQDCDKAGAKVNRWACSMQPLSSSVDAAKLVIDGFARCLLSTGVHGVYVSVLNVLILQVTAQ